MARLLITFLAALPLVLTGSAAMADDSAPDPGSGGSPPGSGGGGEIGN